MLFLLYCAYYVCSILLCGSPVEALQSLSSSSLGASSVAVLLSRIATSVDWQGQQQGSADGLTGRRRWGGQGSVCQCDRHLHHSPLWSWWRQLQQHYTVSRGERRGRGGTSQRQAMADAGNVGLGGRHLDQMHCTKTNEWIIWIYYNYVQFLRLIVWNKSRPWALNSLSLPGSNPGRREPTLSCSSDWNTVKVLHLRRMKTPHWFKTSR